MDVHQHDAMTRDGGGERTVETAQVLLPPLIAKG